MLTGRVGMKVVGWWKVEICYVKKKMDGERLLPADAGRKVMAAEAAVFLSDEITSSCRPAGSFCF